MNEYDKLRKQISDKRNAIMTDAMNGIKKERNHIHAAMKDAMSQCLSAAHPKPVLVLT